MKRTEILSPVGSFESLYAAINSGCDAVYLAGDLYGARKATTKFSLEDIKKIVNICHRYRVKVYITINTLIFDDEISDVLEYTDELYLLGIDAVLIQDMGLINIFSKRYPNLDLHISTQANVKTLEEIKFFEKEPNIKRVVLARETSINEIKRIKENTSLEIEVFVHGAICMGYSGNCLMSSMLFNRSGNRGECAQPCRLKYSLLEDGKVIEDNQYLLSPKELNTIEYIDQLIEIGVDSFKIEGRIKSPEYVALTTSLYKEKVNNPKKNISDIQIENLKRAYNRDFTRGYVFNIVPSSLVNSFRPNHMGVYLGKIISNEETIKIKLESDLYKQDGIRIICDEKDDYGLIVDVITLNNRQVEQAHNGDVVEITSYKMPRFNCKGKEVYVTSSFRLKNELKDKLSENIRRNEIPLKLKVILKEGEYPVLKELNSNSIVVGDFKVLNASTKPLSQDSILNQLNKLIDTPYYINDISFECSDNIFIPMGVLNSLRRMLIEKLDNDALLVKNRIINYQYDFISKEINKNNNLVTNIKVENMEQIDASVEMGFTDIYVYGNDLFYEAKRKYKDVNFKIMFPRIIENYNNFNNFQDALINEVGSLINGMNIDAYLNVTNIYSCNYYFNRGASSITLSHEIGKDNLINFSSRYKEIFKNVPNVEMIIYDKVDLMITKYCLISGHYKTKPYCNICNNHKYILKDRLDVETEILKTSNCGNRIINSKTLCLFEYKELLENSGINRFRINFTTESYDECINVLKNYLNNNNLKGIKYTYGRFLK